MLDRLGLRAEAKLKEWGWYPAGQGEIELTVSGSADLQLTSPKDAVEIGSGRGSLKEIKGVAVASSLPAHIAQRMRDRAVNLLTQAGLPATIEPQRVRSASPGAGIFLAAEYESTLAGFTALGKKGRPSEQVAEEAINELLAFHHSGAHLESHLTDQLMLPAVIAGLCGTVWTEHLTHHTLTNIWVVEQFLGPLVKIDHKRNAINFLQRDSNALTVRNPYKGTQ
jgi:RNA 3'-terminal phosphate cyclase (ATP)